MLGGQWMSPLWYYHQQHQCTGLKFLEKEQEEEVWDGMGEAAVVGWSPVASTPIMQALMRL
jgi:hypothetical protein